MPLFKRQEKVLIPPVPGSTTIDNPSPRQGPKSHANTYVRSRDGDSYNFPSNRSAKPQSQSNRFAGGQADNEGNDEDVEGIKSQTRFIKQDSVNTTRNALRLAREAEETARNTLTKIGDQSGKVVLPTVFRWLTAHQRNWRPLSGTSTSPRVTHKKPPTRQANLNNLTALFSALSLLSIKILSALRKKQRFKLVTKRNDWNESGL